MNAISTRGQAPAVSIADAIAAGLAPDGGLYMPETWPSFTPAQFDGADTLTEVATRFLAPFFAGGALESALPGICRDALAIDPPLAGFGKPDDFLLELFHGPTAAFKDYGAAFLAGCLAALPRGDKPLTIVVATSGDTGAAVAAAFHGLPGFRVAILYPDGRVSPRQAHQLGCFGDNIRAFRVAGSFDDCQRLAKTLLADAGYRAEVPLGSANSISLGRLLPQAAYYAYAALTHWRATGRPLNFVVPTGNLGNALACLLAKRMGLPIGELVLASNANTVLPDFFAGGDYAPQPSIATLANAMDVGAPSNFERLCFLYPDAGELRATLRAEAVSDEQIRAAIVRTREARGHVVCPHTACAAEVLDRLRARGEQGDWAAVATAHPAKFPEVVEPLLGDPVPPPPALAAMLARPSTAEPLADDADALRERLRD
ncbi:threonine synthase [Thermomonas brevis]|uniref:Threonine synthase n=1 Tax=Thermomonas brevis TaxID=215691 RepID=A0A7G9QUQ4_9GAMM|nr:threonine synthase [Thermomonas brevis]QNN47079.1 threonine synthase [Thermomonas brevis]